jgi:hypothetical protein
MSLINPHLGNIITVVGAAAEAIGLPLAILDYGWPQVARKMQGSITNFAQAPFKTLWTNIVAIYSGGTRGDLTPVGAILGGLAAVTGIFFGVRASHGGTESFGSIGIGVAAWLSAALMLAFGTPLPIIMLSRLLFPLAKLSKGRPIGLFGVLLACIGLLVSFYHVLELIIG